MSRFARRIRLFVELSRVSFRRQLAYRTANLAGLATNTFFGLLRAAVMVALYGARQEVVGMSVRDAITYTGITQAVIAYLSVFGWTELMDTVYTGDISSDLLKPMDYFTFWMARDLGRALASMLMRGLTVMLIYALVFDITVPVGAWQWAALLASLLMGWLVSFSWRFLVNLAAFWTPNALGISRLIFATSWLMSGFMMPLRFFPDWFVGICYLTPFPAMINTVVEVYVGVLDAQGVITALAAQAMWAAGLIWVSQVVLRAGIRKLVIQGG